MAVELKNLEDYKAAGYAVTSRKYRIVARIDRPDWKEFQQKKQYPVNADWYRRCVSRDKIKGVPHYVIRHLPNSGDAPYDYRPLPQ